MKKFLLILFFLSFFSCIFYKKWYEEYIHIEAPNWTPQNTILFTQTYEKIEFTQSRLTGEKWISGGEGWVCLWEVDTNQNYRKIGRIFDEPKRFSYLSVASEWVLLSEGIEESIYAIKRDLSEKRYLGKGMYADLSPDGNKFVYVKPKNGLWIKNIDGTGDHCIVPDSNATYPAWSSDGGRIAFYMNYKGLLICDTSGNIIDSLGFRHFPDWGPPDSNAVVATLYSIDKGVIIHLGTHDEDTLNIPAYEWPLFWSPNGEIFISYLTLYKHDGTKLFRIKP